MKTFKLIMIGLVILIALCGVLNITIGIIALIYPEATFLDIKLSSSTTKSVLAIIYGILFILVGYLYYKLVIYFD